MGKFNESEKVGIYIFLINIILVLYALTEIEDKLINVIMSLSSTVVAIIFCTYFIKHTKKSIINIISMILNILTFNVIIALKLLNII